MRSRRLTFEMTEAQYDAVLDGLRIMADGASSDSKRAAAEAAKNKLVEAWYGRAAQPGAVG